MFDAIVKAAIGKPRGPRATHKYVRKEPDGHGGWRYFYLDEHGHEYESRHPPKVEQRQVGLFGDAAMQRVVPTPAAKPTGQGSLFVDLGQQVAAKVGRVGGEAVRVAVKQRLATQGPDLFGWSGTHEPHESAVKVEPDKPKIEVEAARQTVGLGKVARRKANDEALKVARRVLKDRAEKRSEVTTTILTKQDVEALRKYSGDGGIGADLNQYFTRPDVAAAMWQVLAKHGLQPGAKVLEPACGAGVFLETAPKGIETVGVEIDEDPALVARALHGEKSAILHTSFEQFTVSREGLPDTKFDAVIGNAPFCTRTGGVARIHKPGESSADNYFLDTSLDNLKTGGLCAMIVHHGVMDGTNNDGFRELLLARAEVVDAWRLPVQAFVHADATVVSDVVVLRKRDPAVAAALSYGGERLRQALGVHDDDFVRGRFFEAHPDRVLGKAATADETGWHATVEGDAAAAAVSIARGASESTGVVAVPVTLADVRKVAAGADADPVVAEALKHATSIQEVQPKVGATRVIAGSTYVLTGDPPRWHRVDDIEDVAALVNRTGSQALKDAGALARDIGTLLEAIAQGDVYRARGLRRGLAERVKDWIGKNGLPAEHGDLVAISKIDRGMAKLIGAVQPDGSLSDVLSRDAPVIRPTDRIDANDLGAVCEYVAARNDGAVALADVGALWASGHGLTDDALRAAIFDTGKFAVEADGTLRHVEDYLTGNLFEKRDALLAQVPGPERDRQLAWLNARISANWKPLDDVKVEMASRWVPLDKLAEWLNDPERADRRKSLLWNTETKRDPTFGLDNAKVEIAFEDGFYRATITGTVDKTRPGDYGRWEGGRYVPAAVDTIEVTRVDDGTQSLLLKYLNRLPILGKADWPRLDEANGLFARWIKGGEHRADLENAYNRAFFAEVRREYSSHPLNIAGVNSELSINPHLNETVRWADDVGSGIIALDVGLGKTPAGILLARKLKQEGKVRKPAVVVPKSVATNWQREIETFTPGARVLVIGETRRQLKSGKNKGDWIAEPDDDVTRNHKLALAQQNDYDLILITRPAMERISLKADTVKAFEDREFAKMRKESLAATEGKLGEQAAERLSTKKQKEAAKAAEKQAKADAKAAEKQAKADAKAAAKFDQERAALEYQHEASTTYFEDLGIDCLLADEAHAYKNLYAIGARRGGGTPRFLGNPDENVKQAHKMQIVSEVVRKQPGGGRVYFLTATPTKNSPLEIYSMLAHVAPDEWTKRGIMDVEAFVDRYCEIEQRQVLDISGEIVTANVVARFSQLDELRSILDKYVRVRTAADVGLVIPKPDEEKVLVDMNADQHAIYENLRTALAEANVKEDKGIVLKLIHNMRVATQNPDLVDEQFGGGKPSDTTATARIMAAAAEGRKLSRKKAEKPIGDRYLESPKYKALVDRVVAKVKAGKEAEAAAGRRYDGHGQVVFLDYNSGHQQLKAMMVAAGLQPSEVEILNADEVKDSETRQDIGDRFNRGEVSVVIGNTGVMGEGVNLQKRTTDIHHLDQPWDPGTMQQRNGRGVRQGNKNQDVKIHTYLAKRSFDGYMYETLKGKKTWLDKLRAGADSVVNDQAEAEAFGGEDLQVLLAADPEAAAKELAATKAAKNDAWKAKRAAEASVAFGKLFQKRQRLVEFQASAAARGKANDATTQQTVAVMQRDIESATLALERNDNLPAALKSALRGEALDGLVDSASGRLYLKGVVLAPFDAKEARWGGKWTVEGVDTQKQTMTLRPWGGNTTITKDLAEVAKTYGPVDGTSADEVRHALDHTFTAARSGDIVLHTVTNMPVEVVAPHADTVRAGLATYLRTHPDQTLDVGVIGLDGALTLHKSKDLSADDRVAIHVGTDEQAWRDAIADELYAAAAQGLVGGYSYIYSEAAKAYRAAEKLFGYKTVADWLDDAHKIVGAQDYQPSERGRAMHAAATERIGAERAERVRQAEMAVQARRHAEAQAQLDREQRTAAQQDRETKARNPGRAPKDWPMETRFALNPTDDNAWVNKNWTVRVPYGDVAGVDAGTGDSVIAVKKTGERKRVILGELAYVSADKSWLYFKPAGEGRVE